MKRVQEKTEEYDYLIVGCGFAGTVLAERLAGIDKKVLIIDKRNHIGGNSYDYYNADGVLVHKYGPHYFRTSSKKVFEYLSEFTQWRFYEYRVRAFVNGELYPFPINRDTLNRFFKINLRNEHEAKEFLKKNEKTDNPKNSEEVVVSKVGRKIYEVFFKNYTKKQWGIDANDLDPKVCARIPIRTNLDDRYFTDNYQAMPKGGYFKIFERMLKNKKITVRLNTCFNEIKSDIKYKKLVYTGRIDEFFDFRFGKLPYRSLHFEHKTYDRQYYQEWSQINYPNDYNYTRIVEIKHATGQICPKTTIVKEYPRNCGEPYYPIPTEKNHELYERYSELAKKLKDTIFIGRLAEYEYLNMDQVIKKALETFETINRE